MEQQKPKHSIPANVLHFLGVAYKNYKLVFVFFLVQVIIGSILPLLGLYLPRLAVDLALENRGVTHVVITLGTFAGVYVILQCLNGLAQTGIYPFQNIMRNLYHREMFFTAMNCDYDIMETTDGKTWYNKAWECINRGDSSVTYSMINGVQRLISGGIAFIFIAGILSMLNPLIVVLLVVLSVLGFVIDGFPRRYDEKHRDANADVNKKIGYVDYTMSDISAAKDMRLYNLPALVSGIKEKLFAQMYNLSTKVKNRYFAAESLTGLLSVIRDAAAYAFCIWNVIQGNITVPDFVLFMSAIAVFSNWLRNIAGEINGLKWANVEANDLRAFFEYTNRMDPVNPADISELGSEISIEFRNVSFQYSKTTPLVLDGINFSINYAEKVALVGVNGAGKTTIVKLLCGFYKATTGEILLNGRNIDEFKRAGLYTLFSAVFQDICILPFTVAENVTFQPQALHDPERIWECLTAAGVNEVIAAHPQGINAPMTKIMDEDGLILSGGEQQKLTIARALYKNAPILILDEPTAALDPIAESEVYDKFHEVTANKTAIYISHRLASTRFCDKILMLKDGRIVEQGSHHQLMEQGGEYANMFEIQSHYYQEEVHICQT